MRAIPGDRRDWDVPPPGLLYNLAPGGSLLEGLPPEDFRILATELQSPQHMLPHLWRMPQWLAFGGYLVLAGLVLWFSRDGTRLDPGRLALPDRAQLHASYPPLAKGGLGGWTWPNLYQGSRSTFLYDQSPSSRDSAWRSCWGSSWPGWRRPGSRSRCCRTSGVTVFQPFRMATLARGSGAGARGRPGGGSLAPRRRLPPAPGGADRRGPHWRLDVRRCGDGGARCDAGRAFVRPRGASPLRDAPRPTVFPSCHGMTPNRGTGRCSQW